MDKIIETIAGANGGWGLAVAVLLLAIGTLFGYLMKVLEGRRQDGLEALKVVTNNTIAMENLSRDFRANVTAIEALASSVRELTNAINLQAHMLGLRRPMGTLGIEPPSV